MADWDELAAALSAATGADAALDRMIAAAFGVEPAEFTGSVGAARAVATGALSGWKFHVGYDANGMFPYAAMTLGDRHIEANAPTVPLSILKAAVAAKRLASPTPTP